MSVFLSVSLIISRLLFPLSDYRTIWVLDPEVLLDSRLCYC